MKIAYHGAGSRISAVPNLGNLLNLPSQAPTLFPISLLLLLSQRFSLERCHYSPDAIDRLLFVFLALLALLAITLPAFPLSTP